MWVYRFEEGSAKLVSLLGGKGAGIAEMTRLGLPVPPGMTVTTEACRAYFASGNRLPEGLEDEISQALRWLEEKTGKKFGDPFNPLLVSVRSGAPVSMPGMMDTVLNLGLNDVTVEGLAKRTGDERFAYDCYRRFIQMFGSIVLHIPRSKFDDVLNSLKEKCKVKLDTELDAESLKTLVNRYKEIFRQETGRDLPQDPKEQLLMAVKAVFKSWNGKRAVEYRRFYKIPSDLGTAVNIQAMVFGNIGPNSGTGVAFTRNPSTGEAKIYGEYLMNAQGEEVVAGIRTPKHIDELRLEAPQLYEQLEKVCHTLERHYRDMQDIEFTIEEGKLYMLQTRTGKRTAQAAVKIAIDMADEGLITKEEALLRVQPSHLEQLLHRHIDPNAKVNVIAKGLPASPGAASGMVIFDVDEAARRGAAGEKVILVRPETTPEDIHGMVQAQGVLTSRGGMTCHAAVVARGMGKPAVVGCEELNVDVEAEFFKTRNIIIKKGDVITLDGSTGSVILGEVPMIDPEVRPELKRLLELADEIRTLGVRANADTPENAARARTFGAEGIGLCRTERMFNAKDRLPIVQEMILADTEEERRAALEKLRPMQKKDFKEIFRVCHDQPVTIRLLDLPLHEFLPRLEDLLVEVTTLKCKGEEGKELETKERILKRALALNERNPMLGHRGCRLSIRYPEIYEMQIQAIFEAAIELLKEEGVKVELEIMLPLVGEVNEFIFHRNRIVEVANRLMEAAGVKIPYLIGTMIEIPRAALTADEIAKHAEFFSFGTNDLTQTTFGYSRDDAEAKFLHDYLEKKILTVNPFEVLDRAGVGELVRIATEKGRSVRKNLKVGVCGEHGGEPSSIEFFHKIKLDYVSCSPFRVPVARLAAAQAKIREKIEVAPRDTTI
ncbi:MAG: pyruvate, phosphate dikinase [Candidatus Bathyarchaeia archaeon]